jgi:hypothetical protein
MVKYKNEVKWSDPHIKTLSDIYVKNATHTRHIIRDNNIDTNILLSFLLNQTMLLLILICINNYIWLTNWQFPFNIYVLTYWYIRILI